MLWVVQQCLIGTYGFSETLLPPTPNADGSLPSNDCYRPQTFNPLSGQANPLVPKHGNTLLMQLVLNGMKRNPILTGGENACVVWEGFAERGLSVDATVVGSTPPSPSPSPTRSSSCSRHGVMGFIPNDLYGQQ
ncbi:hypothetical protein PAXINDRAFT_103283 [Paxillus involutus ATCC 200175]|uniref:Fungalysin n=1 Tax=Paxillus involutus ATCC 200175 TaxID=664439 RepID=A0A0C9SVJ0_PAXIN|nr:hypothetical protein PAXINDRAFT_103283 [Paxillus involutus ATCC 200175]